MPIVDQFDLYSRTSNIPNAGDGLFCATDIHWGAVVAWFDSQQECATWQAWHEMLEQHGFEKQVDGQGNTYYGEDDFAVECNKKVYYDGAVFSLEPGVEVDQLSSMAMWHKTNHSKQNANVRFKLIGGQVVLQAHCAGGVLAHQELLLDYGKEVPSTWHN
jgi:hypothetical protein